MKSIAHVPAPKFIECGLGFPELRGLIEAYEGGPVDAYEGDLDPELWN